MSDHPAPIPPKSYHHGGLRAALIDAAEAELAERGYAGFTLRGTAKRAGVSHAAPAHHFRDAAALLAALAARGHDRLAAAMSAEIATAAPDPTARLLAAGIGYYRFATANPALLQLMLGPDRSLDDDPALQASAQACFGILVELVSARRGAPALDTAPGREDLALAWAVVHGLSVLATADRLAFLGERGTAGEQDHVAAILAASIGAGPRPGLPQSRTGALREP